MGLDIFKDDDLGYLAWIARRPNGYVVNIPRSLNPRSARLHLANCRTIGGTSPRQGPWTGAYLKVCSESARELEDWALLKVGCVIATCATCHSPNVVPEVVSEIPQDGFKLRVSHGVDFWSLSRLGFNGDPQTLQRRSAIGGAVRQLEAGPGEILSAVYTAGPNGLVDAENILLYNVGPGYFRNATSRGLRFERVYARPADAAWQHHHNYRLVARDSESPHWLRGRTVVSVEAIPIPRMSDTSHPDGVWLAVRSRAQTSPRHQGRYGLRVILTTPESRVRISNLLKPLLDGLIAGLHAHDGFELELVAARLALRMGRSENEIRQRLMEPAEAVLGVRRLLRKWGKSTQWNPGDDECVSCTLLHRADPEARGWSIDAELFEVTPR